MKALLYGGPGKKALEDRPRPPMREATGAIVRLVKATVCGTGPYILRATSRLTRRAAAVALTAMDEVQSV
jgi:threonine dehydrogenase-like Zn-dependent dehydrogenase